MAIKEVIENKNKYSTEVTNTKLPVIIAQKKNR